MYPMGEKSWITKRVTISICSISLRSKSKNSLLAEELCYKTNKIVVNFTISVLKNSDGALPPDTPAATALILM